MAGTSIGSTALYLSADASEFQKGLDHAEQLFRAYAAKTKAESAALNKQVKSSFGFGDILGTAAGVAGGLGIAGGFSKLGSVLPGIVSDSIKLAASVEATQTDFEVMLGDAKKAAELFADIREFGARTPLQTDDLADAAKLLLGVGVSAQQVVPTLRALGDLAGASGDKLKTVATIYAQAMTQGVVTGETLNRLNENLIPITDSLAKALRVSTAEIKTMASEGKISFSDLQRGIILATDEGGRFFNRLEKQSKTFNGLISTLEDNWKALLGTVGQAAIEEFGLKDEAEKLAKLFEKGKDGVDELRPTLRLVKEQAVEVGGALFDGFANATVAVAGLVNWVDRLRKSLDMKADDGVLGSARSLSKWTEKWGTIGGLAGQLGMDAEGWLGYAGPGGAGRLVRTGFLDNMAGIANPPAGKDGDLIDVRRLAESMRALRDTLSGKLLTGETGTVMGAAWAASLKAAGIDLGKFGGKNWGEGAAGKIAPELDRLTQKMLDQVKGLRDEFDPMSKIRRELDELQKIRDRGGFNIPGLVGMIGRAAGGGVDEGLFDFAKGKIFKGLLGSVDFQKQVGIATAGSSEAVGAIVNAQNAGMIRPEDKVVAAIKAQEALRREQFRAVKRLVDLIEQRQVPGVF